MSKRINVNPWHYKVAGRERQGEAIVQHAEKERYSERQAEVEDTTVRSRPPRARPERSRRVKR